MRWVAIPVALVTLLVLSPAPVPAATDTIQITAKEFSFTPATITLRAGRYSFWCAETLKGKLHRDLGMKGTLRVVP